MEAKKSISYLLLIIGILVIGLAACIGYIMGNSGDNATVSKKSFTSDEQVMQEIEELKAMYDAKISEKTASFKELKDEKAKVEKLVYELEQTKADANSLLKYKTEYQNLESKMRLLVDEIVTLKGKKSNAKATIIKQQSKSVFDNGNASFKVNSINTTSTPKVKSNKKDIFSPAKSTVESKPIVQETSKPVEKQKETAIAKETPVKPSNNESFAYENATVSNLKSAGYNIKSLTKTEETTSASKTDVIKVQFILDANPKVKPEQKQFYIQVIDTKNNVMGRKITEYIGDKTLTYSFSRIVFYNNEQTSVLQEISAEKFEKGTYFVNIFDKTKLVAKTSFTLK
jgi:hypothetical protein